MKSTDKFVLVLVASLALLLAGCGGGSSTTAPPVDPGPTAAEQAIMDAEAALTTAQAGMSSAMTDAEKRDAYRAIQSAANNLVMVLKANNGSLAAVEAATTTRENAKSMADNLAMKVADAEAAADKAMMAMAAKLYNAIGTAPLAAARLTDITASGGIEITNGAVVIDGTANSTVAQLEEDKMAMVAPLHGWVGSQQTTTVETGTNAGTYTAQMYSNVGEPAQGDPFDVAHPFNAVPVNTVNTEFTIDTGTTAVQELVASSRFDQTAGKKEFELPANTVKVMISGSYHGVSGDYSCTPPAGGSCTATVAPKGFTLGGDNADGSAGTATWTFKPNNPKDRVTGTPDDVYAVYGWWLHETEDGAYVSAFADYRGTPEAASGITALQGSATYKGGAAGKYTVRAGAVNDAGHFTADAELMADFSDNTVTGTIDNFMGSDGMARDWSVGLKKSYLGDTGVINHLTSAANEGNQKTTWTMGGSAASAAGAWSGTLYENNDGGVPKVGTGTFHSTYGNIGRMVGAFGVNLEE